MSRFNNLTNDLTWQTITSGDAADSRMFQAEVNELTNHNWVSRDEMFRQGRFNALPVVTPEDS